MQGWQGWQPVQSMLCYIKGAPNIAEIVARKFDRSLAANGADGG